MNDSVENWSKERLVAEVARLRHRVRELDRVSSRRVGNGAIDIVGADLGSNGVVRSVGAVERGCDLAGLPILVVDVGAVFEAKAGVELVCAEGAVERPGMPGAIGRWARDGARAEPFFPILTDHYPC